MTEFNWLLRGRCYKLGHDVPHPGGVIPNRLIVAREMDPQKLIPHLFEETDPGFHTRAKPGDIIVTGRNFGMGRKRTATSRCRRWAWASCASRCRSSPTAPRSAAACAC